MSNCESAEIKVDKDNKAQKMATTNSLKCLKCFQLFSSKEKLLHHLLQKQCEEKKIESKMLKKCNKCGKKFPSTLLFKNHFLTTHTDDDSKGRFKFSNLFKLHKAAREGKVQVVEWLIESGDQIEERDQYEMTALHFSALFGHLEVTKFLVEKGAQMDVKNKEGNTPLHEAIDSRHTEVVKYLLEKSASIDVRNENDETPICLAHDCPEVLNIIIEILGSQSSFEWLKSEKPHCPTLLHYAAKKNYLEVIKHLIESGIDIDSENNLGSTPLHLAIENQHFDVVKCLIDNGANVDIRDKEDFTPLIKTCKVEADNEDLKLEIVKYLIDNGAQIDANTEGEQAIHKAAACKNLKIVKYLIEKGAQIDAKNKDEKTALIIALEHFCTTEIVKFLLRHGAQVNVKDKNGKTPLIIAVSAGFHISLETVKILVGYGAQIDAKDKNNKTTLHYAAVSGQFGNVKYLTKCGIMIDARDKDGMTPLHLVAQRYDTYFYSDKTVEQCKADDKALVKYLIENGAKINVKNNKGQTPIDVARKEEMKKYLSENQSKTISEETVSNQDPCIICHGPRNGFYVLMPCGHASLCEECCKTITKQKFAKCPSCRRPTKSYTKIFFQAPE